MWELKSWFDESKLSPFYLSYNPNAVDYLSKYKYFIDWQALSQNENAIHILLQNPDKIDWHNLSLNPSASYVLAKNMSYINWSNISKNPGSIDLILNFDKAPYRNKYNFNQNPHPKAIQYFLDNPDEIVWESISNNENAIKIFEKYGYSKVDWFALSKNPRAIDILLSNTQYIYWPLFSINPHPKAVEYLKCNPHLIDWTFLSMNPSAEEIILENLDKYFAYEFYDSDKSIKLYNIPRLGTVSNCGLILKSMKIDITNDSSKIKFVILYDSKGTDELNKMIENNFGLI